MADGIARLTAALEQLSELQRKDLAVLMQYAMDDVRAYLDGDKAKWQVLQTWGAELLEPLIRQYGDAAGALAADWYEYERERRSVAGTAPAIGIQEVRPNTGGLVGWVLSNSANVDGFTGNIEGGVERRLFQAANGTLMDATLADKQGVGWARIAQAGGCAYCLMLAGRGHVYRTEQTASFAPHDHCRCVVSPVWDSGQKIAVPSEYTPSQRFGGNNPTEAQQRARAQQNAQAQRWIAQNRESLGLIGAV